MSTFVYYFIPEDEPYHSIKVKTKKQKPDIFKLKLLKVVLKDLKKLDKDK